MDTADEKMGACAAASTTCAQPHAEQYYAYCGSVQITKTTVMKTTTQGFLFSFQGGGKWSAPKGGIQWSGFGLRGGDGGMGRMFSL